MTPAPDMSLAHAMMERVDLDAGLPASAILSTVDVGSVSLAVADMPASGTQRGVALMIPGFTSSRSTFYPLFQMLADQGFRVVSFSQRGQPGSTGGDATSDYSLPALGSDVHKLADALELGSNIHLLGHSFGGVVGIETVVQNPARFASFTMWNSGPDSLGEPIRQSIGAVQAYGARGLWLGEAQMAGLDPNSDLTGELDEMQAFRYTRLMLTNPAQLEAGLTHLYEHRDRSSELRDAGLPMLISHGANDDAWPIESQRLFAQRLDADYWVVANAGHSAHADRPETSAALLGAFWSTLA